MNIAIILSGGTGTRMGLSIPKQYVEVNGIPVIQYCLKTLLGHKMVDMAVIAVADEWQDFVQQCVDRLSPKIPVYYSQPGDTRQGSIINALKVTKQKGAKDNDIVLIHDAARPLLSASLAADCINACKDAVFLNQKLTLAHCIVWNAAKGCMIAITYILGKSQVNQSIV